MVAQSHQCPPGAPSILTRAVPLGSVSESRTKRACDVAFGCALVPFVFPVILVLWAIVRLTSPGPGFYSQVRVGRGSELYRIYKIRTMANNCEAKTGVQWASKGDARVTPVGRVLRKLHLDELPQLWNVIRGDMSLVGPRPERPEFVVPLSAEIEGYPERHRVRPGVTGLAQIQLPADSSLESVQTKLVLDRYYVENGNFGLDLRIMLGTVVYLCGLSYARVRRAVWLPNPLAECETPPPAEIETLLRGDPVTSARESSLAESDISSCGGAQ